MDLASILGLIICGVLIVFGITFERGTGFVFSKLENFWDIPSILITIGGTFTCVLASNSMKDFVKGIKSFVFILKEPKEAGRCYGSCLGYDRYTDRTD